MRLRRFLSFAFAVMVLSSVCQADTVHLAYVGVNDAIGCGFCLGPIPGDTYLTLDTHSWSRDVQVGSSTDWLKFATVKYKSPSDLQGFVDWGVTQGYGPGGNALSFNVGWETTSCLNFLVTVGGELPGAANCTWYSEPQITIGPDPSGGPGLGSTNASFVIYSYSAFYPQHNVSVTAAGADQGGAAEWNFGDSPNEQDQDIYIYFDVKGVPEPGTALLFAGAVPVLLYRRLRRRGE